MNGKSWTQSLIVMRWANECMAKLSVFPITAALRSSGPKMACWCNKVSNSRNITNFSFSVGTYSLVMLYTLRQTQHMPWTVLSIYICLLYYTIRLVVVKAACKFVLNNFLFLCVVFVSGLLFCYAAILPVYLPCVVTTLPRRQTYFRFLNEMRNELIIHIPASMQKQSSRQGMRELLHNVIVITISSWYVCGMGIECADMYNTLIKRLNKTTKKDWIINCYTNFLHL